MKQWTEPEGTFTGREIWLQAFAVWTKISHPISTMSAEKKRSMVPKDMSSSIILALSSGASGKLLALCFSTVAAYHSQKINKNLQAGRDWEEKWGKEKEEEEIHMIKIPLHWSKQRSKEEAFSRVQKKAWPCLVPLQLSGRSKPTGLPGWPALSNKKKTWW